MGARRARSVVVVFACSDPLVLTLDRAAAIGSKDSGAARERAGRLDAGLAVTSRRELEALLLDEPAADRDDVGVVLLAGVLAHLGQRDLHAEGGAVGAV